MATLTIDPSQDRTFSQSPGTLSGDSLDLTQDTFELAQGGATDLAFTGSVTVVETRGPAAYRSSPRFRSPSWITIGAGASL